MADIENKNNTIVASAQAQVKVSILKADEANSSLSKLGSSFSKLQSSAQNMSSAFGNFSGVMSRSLTAIAGVSLSIKDGADSFMQYNKAVLSSASVFSKYGIGINQVKQNAQSLSKTLSLTRIQTIGLMKQYQKGFPLNSFSGAQKLFKNLKQAVGSNSEQMKNMLSIASELSTKFPTLQSSIQRMNSSDRSRLSSINQARLAMGQLDLAQAKRYSTFINMNSQMSTADKQQAERAKQRIQNAQKLKRVFQEVSLSVGENLMPVLKSVSQILNNNTGYIKDIIKFTATWGVGIGIALGGLKAVTSTLSSIKSLGGLIGGEDKKDKLSGYTPKLGGSGINGIGRTGPSGSVGDPLFVIDKNIASQSRSGSQMLFESNKSVGGLDNKQFLSRKRSGFQLGRKFMASNPARYIGRNTRGIRSFANKSVGNFGKFAGSAKGVGLGLALQAGSIGAGYASEYLRQSGDTRAAGGVGMAGGLMGAAGMGLTGAAIGSIFGPIGTALGGIAGTALGIYQNWDSISKGFKQFIGKQSKDESKRGAYMSIQQANRDINKRSQSQSLVASLQVMTPQQNKAFDQVKKQWDKIRSQVQNKPYVIEMKQKQSSIADRIKNIQHQQQKGGITDQKKAELEKELIQAKKQQLKIQNQVQGLSKQAWKDSLNINEAQEYANKLGIEKTAIDAYIKQIKAQNIADGKQGNNVFKTQIQLQATRLAIAQKISNTQQGRINAINNINKLLQAQNGLVSAQFSLLQSMTSSGVQFGFFNKDQIKKQGQQAFQSASKQGQLLNQKKKYIQKALQDIIDNKGPQNIGNQQKQDIRKFAGVNAQEVIKAMQSGKMTQLARVGIQTSLVKLSEQQVKNEKEKLQSLQSIYNATKLELQGVQAVANARAAMSSKMAQMTIKFGLDPNKLKQQSQMQIQANNKTQQAITDNIIQARKYINNLIQKSPASANSKQVKQKQAQIVNLQAKKLQLQISNNQATKLTLKYYTGISSLAKSQVQSNRSLLDSLIAQASASGKGGSAAQQQLSVVISQIRLQKQKLIKQQLQAQNYYNQQQNKQGQNAIQAKNKILNLQSQITTKSIQQFKQRQKILSINNELLQGQKLNTSYAQGLVSLANNFATGIGASASMQMNVVKALKSQAITLQQNMNRALKNRNQATSDDAIITAQNAIKKIRQQQLQNIQAQVDATKTLRQGWISAIAASTTGQGRITKIMIDQRQNLAGGLSYLGMVRSDTSGAVARKGQGFVGKNVGARFSQFGGLTGNLGAGYVSDVNKSLGINPMQFGSDMVSGGGNLMNAISKSLMGGGGAVSGLNSSNMRQLNASQKSLVIQSGIYDQMKKLNQKNSNIESSLGGNYITPLQNKNQQARTEQQKNTYKIRKRQMLQQSAEKSTLDQLRAKKRQMQKSGLDTSDISYQINAKQSQQDKQDRRKRQQQIQDELRMDYQIKDTGSFSDQVPSGNNQASKIGTININLSGSATKADAEMLINALQQHLS